MLYANHSIIFRKQMQVKTCLSILDKKKEDLIEPSSLFRKIVNEKYYNIEKK